MSEQAPLTPPDCDLRDFPRMMIDITRLRQSDFDAITDDAAWRAGVNLWFSAWHSVPAGSLSSDDAGLAKAAGLGRDLRTWRKVKDDALRGFRPCSDGRLYHETVCELALEAWLEKLVQRISSGAGNAKRWGVAFDPTSIKEEIDRVAAMLAVLAPHSKSIAKAKRLHSRSDPAGTSGASRRDNESIPAGSQGKGTGKEEEKEEPPKPPRKREGSGKHLLPEDWQLPPVEELPPQARKCAVQWTAESYATHGEAFICYWRSERKMKSDWRGTWANRVIALHSQVMRDQRFAGQNGGHSGGDLYEKYRNAPPRAFGAGQ